MECRDSFHTLHFVAAASKNIYHQTPQLDLNKISVYCLRNLRIKATERCKMCVQLKLFFSGFLPYGIRARFNNGQSNRGLFIELFLSGKISHLRLFLKFFSIIARPAFIQRKVIFYYLFIFVTSSLSID